MTGIVTKKDNISTDTINHIIKEYNNQVKRESEAFQTLTECRNAYENTFSESDLNSYESVLEWYLQMTYVSENLMAVLEAYGEIEWID